MKPAWKNEYLERIINEIKLHEDKLDHEFGTYNHGYNVALATIIAFIRGLQFEKDETCMEKQNQHE